MTKAKNVFRFVLIIVSLGMMSFVVKASSVTPVLKGESFRDSTLENEDNSFKKINTRYKAATERLQVQATAARTFVNANNYNADYVFLLDMSIPSGKKRFFIYDLNRNEIIASALVTHGFGSKVMGNDEILNFSNEPSSLKTSLGRYKIGASYTGNFGLSYKLYGLDNSNSNAYERAIVIHAHKSIPTTETYPIPIGESFGCPSVAPSFLNTLTKYIQGSSKPVMMWIYN